MAVSIPGMAAGGTKGGGGGVSAVPDGSRSVFISQGDKPQRSFFLTGQGSWPHALFLKKFPGMCE